MSVKDIETVFLSLNTMFEDLKGKIDGLSNKYEDLEKQLKKKRRSQVLNATHVVQSLKVSKIYKNTRQKKLLAKQNLNVMSVKRLSKLRSNYQFIPKSMKNSLVRSAIVNLILKAYL
jgi:hypothetical protein